MPAVRFEVAPPRSDATPYPHAVRDAAGVGFCGRGTRAGQYCVGLVALGCGLCSNIKPPLDPRAEPSTGRDTPLCEPLRCGVWCYGHRWCDGHAVCAMVEPRGGAKTRLTSRFPDVWLVPPSNVMDAGRGKGEPR
jgi:hypothetical protein